MLFQWKANTLTTTCHTNRKLSYFKDLDSWSGGISITNRSQWSTTPTSFMVAIYILAYITFASR